MFSLLAQSQQACSQGANGRQVPAQVWFSYGPDTSWVLVGSTETI
jgi:hypothetical protein